MIRGATRNFYDLLRPRLLVQRLISSDSENKAISGQKSDEPPDTETHNQITNVVPASKEHFKTESSIRNKENHRLYQSIAAKSSNDHCKQSISIKTNVVFSDRPNDSRIKIFNKIFD